MSHEDILQQLKEHYLQNIPTTLGEMEDAILHMEKGNCYQDNFEALYRHAHSLKGSGGTYGFSIITSACHQMEDYISTFMQNEDALTQEHVNVIFSYIDLLKDIHKLLLAKTDQFDSIENKLKALKALGVNHSVNGIYVSSERDLYSQLCEQVFNDANVNYTQIQNGIATLQRILHEHFDFIVTGRENSDLNGMALIAAIKLNQKKDSNLKTILITSNPPEATCSTTEPDYVVLKNKSFDANLLKAIESIKKVN